MFGVVAVQCDMCHGTCEDARGWQCLWEHLCHADLTQQASLMQRLGTNTCTATSNASTEKVQVTRHERSLRYKRGFRVLYRLCGVADFSDPTVAVTHTAYFPLFDMLRHGSTEIRQDSWCDGCRDTNRSITGPGRLHL